MYLLKFILFIGPCHTYIQQRGKTAGFQDCHCPHRFKICTKMQAAQETVSDPSNIIHSMKKRPIVLICDDACTVAEYETIHYPHDSEICFGERKGCFQKPVKGIKPTSGIDCKVIKNYY